MEFLNFHRERYFRTAEFWIPMYSVIPATFHSELSQNRFLLICFRMTFTQFNRILAATSTLSLSYPRVLNITIHIHPSQGVPLDSTPASPPPDNLHSNSQPHPQSPSHILSWHLKLIHSSSFLEGSCSYSHNTPQTHSIDTCYTDLGFCDTS